MGATPFQKEAWTEYGIGTLVLFLRYFARWKAVGFKEWQGDDYFAIAVLVFWTVCDHTVTLRLCAFPFDC